MLTVKRGDILNAEQGLILHQVNCQGVMGSGVAKAIRNKWPVVYQKYNRICAANCANEGEGLLGLFQRVAVGEGMWVGNLFGQQFYGRNPGSRYTSYDALDAALETAAGFCREHNISMVHYPMLGAGLGNGNWNVIQCLIQQHIGEFEQTLWLQ